MPSGPEFLYQGQTRARGNAEDLETIAGKSIKKKSPAREQPINQLVSLACVLRPSFVPARTGRHSMSIASP